MRKWYDIRNEAEAKTVRIDIYGAIGKSRYDDDATSAKDLMDAIRNADKKPIEIHVNSEGGSVFDGFAMYTLLRDSESYVTVYIDGLAASAASYLIMAANRIVMSDLAWIMIHNASSFAWGDKKSMRKEAEVLDNIDQTIASAYAGRSSLYDEGDFIALMNEETWLDADEAKKYGLIDEISAAMPVAAHLDLTDTHLLDRAPEKARKAIMAMSDTDEKITKDDDEEEDSSFNPVDPDEEEPETEESEEEETEEEKEEEPEGEQKKKNRSYRVIDGRLFRINGRKEG